MKKYLSLLLLAMTLSLQAQWNPDTSVNTLVVDAIGGDMKAIGASDGSTFVVFWKSVGAPENYELRLQVLDPDGNQTLGSDGALVSVDLPMSTSTVIWNISVDDQDHLYIGATGTAGGDPAYAFKMDLQGNALWGSAGLSLGAVNLVRVKPLTTGDVLVSWWPGGAGVVQKFDSQGNAIWATPMPIELGSSSTVTAELFELSTGEFIVVFHELLNGISSYLHAQKLDAQGAPLWNLPVQISNNVTAFIRDYPGMMIGDDVYLGYYASIGSRFDAYLQRIESDGTLPWGINGSDFDTSQAYYEMTAYMAHEAGSNSIWMASTYTNSSQGIKGTFVQRYDRSNGQRLLGDGAKEVFALGSENIPVGGMYPKEEGVLMLIKQGLDNGGSPTTLGTTYLDSAGDFVWPETIRDVATFAANKSRIHYTAPINNQSVAVFIEQKAGQPKIYAQNFLDEEVVLAGPDQLLEVGLHYINPVKDRISLVSSEPMHTFRVYNALGQLIYSSNSATTNLDVSVAHWPSGWYVLTCVDAAGTLRHIKLLKP